MSDFLFLASTALPQLRATRLASPHAHWRGPRRSVVGGGDVVAVRRVHRVGRGVGDVVALVENVDLAAWLDDHRRAVTATRWKARTHVRHRAPRLAAVGRSLHDGV